MAEPPVPFADVLRELRVRSGLTQEELADAAKLTSRTISDLERGVVSTPQRDTVRLLAEALRLDGWARVEFESAARGRVTPGGAGAVRIAAATRTLPRDIASFTGRRQELRRLADAAGAAGGVVSIHAIGGMAGVGKTAFAVHAAHALADRFPAGQVFLPLHGHTPGRQPVSPAEALGSLLLIMGIPAGQIPAELEARTALWRDRLAGQRLLLVLDDVVGSEQVQPLLPGAGDTLVLITSRRRLTVLADAQTISLDTLPPGEAAELLVRLAVRPGLASSDPEVRELIRLCGCLPLAVGMVARQLYHHPAWTVADRAAELSAAVDRLGLLATENLSVAAAFDLSYGDLSADQQRLFRRLGLHPGADIDPYAAAALDDNGLDATRRNLEALYEQYLLTEPAPRRYRMHDLIREHARALADRLDPDQEREQATARLLDYYQHAAAQADALLTHQARAGWPPKAGTRPAAVPVMPGWDQALAWARAERASLIACLDQVTAAGQHTRVVALTAGLAGLLRIDGPPHEAGLRLLAAVQAARELNDAAAEAGALTELGDLKAFTGDWAGATRDLEPALLIYRRLGDRLGQANVLNTLGMLRQVIGDFARATWYLQEALDLSRDVGDSLGQSLALISLGIVRKASGDYRGAITDLRESLAVATADGHRPNQARARNYLGDMLQLTGDLPGAARELHAALALYQDAGEREGCGHVLTYLGRLSLETGDVPGAMGYLEEAQAIYTDIGFPLGQGHIWCYLGRHRTAAGDYQAADQALGRARDIYRSIGHSVGSANVLNDYGTLHRSRGHLGEARSCHQQALEAARRLGAVPPEANALAGLGRCSRAGGCLSDAEDELRQALAIYEKMGAAEAAGVAAELDALAARRVEAQDSHTQ